MRLDVHTSHLMFRCARAGNYFEGKVAAFERVMGKFNGEMAV